MPKRMVWLYICSICKVEYDSPEKVTGYQLAILDSKGEPGQRWSLDICTTCQENDPGLRTVLEAGIKEGKVPRNSTATPDNQTACPDCGDLFTHAGLSLHRAKAHGVTTQNAIKEAAKGTGPLKCPECGFGSTGSQGLAAHRRSVHGVEGSGKSATKSQVARQALGTIACTEPGCDWRGGSPQGLGVHRRYAHGITHKRNAQAAKKK